jgi:hypothetical protein
MSSSSRCACGSQFENPYLENPYMVGYAAARISNLRTAVPLGKALLFKQGGPGKMPLTSRVFEFHL